jgi:hypothetical protein
MLVFAKFDEVPPVPKEVPFRLVFGLHAVKSVESVKIIIKIIRYFFLWGVDESWAIGAPPY